MATDLAIDLSTGDLVFSQNRDLAFAQGEVVTQQRVHVRMIIPEGSFIYDTTGTLGSNLAKLLNEGVDAAASVPMLIQDALESMTDINVISVTTNVYGDGSGLVTDPRQILATLVYSQNMAEVSYSTPTPSTTATFILPTAA